MRIAIYHNLPSGGAKRALQEWTRRLAADHELDVYTLTSGTHDFCDLRPFVREHRVFQFTPRRLFQRPWGRLNRLQRWLDLGQLGRLGEHIAGEINGAYDVLFAHPCQYTLIPFVLMFTQIPSVYYLHEPFGPTFTRHIQRPYCDGPSAWRQFSKQIDPLFFLYDRRLERRRLASVQRVTRFLANSSFTQQQIRIAYGVEAPISPLGVDCDVFRPMPSVSKRAHVVSVGALTPRKGFDFLIEALAHVSPAVRPTLELVSNGEIPAERAFLEQLSADRGVDLQILTNLDSVPLAREYNSAKLCVYAPVKEPFGLVPLEAMACGTPVVGVQEGGVPESVVDGVTGLLVDRDPQQFAAAVQSLLQDADRRTRYGQQAREHVLNNWTWHRSVAEIERHLKEVSEQHG